MPPFSRLEYIGQLAIDYKLATDKYCENAGEGYLDELGEWYFKNPELDKKLETDMNEAADLLEQQINSYVDIRK